MRVYGVFLPYHKGEIMDESFDDYEKLPSYPREYRRVRLFPNRYIQMEVYANTMCPASRIFDCEEEEVNDIVEQLHKKYDDENWLEENIYPYV